METPAAEGAPTPKGARRKTVVVFGASWAQHGSDLYAESVDLGRRLAAQGFTLVNGGYGGTMEGTAKGAAEVAGSERVGVIVSPLFPNRREGGNAFLTTVIDTPTLTARIEAMVAQSDYFVVMPGTLGTLTELCIVWNVASLSALTGRRPPLLVAYAEPWRGVVESLGAALALPADHTRHVRFVDDAAATVDAIAEDWEAAARGEKGPAAGVRIGT